MTEAIESAIAAISAVVATVSGIDQVNVNPPEGVGDDTFAVVYAEHGEIDIAPVGTRESLHNIAIDVLTTRTDLARDMALMKPFIDTVGNALLAEMSYDSDGTMGDVFSNTIETFGKLTYSWISTDYGGVPVVGYHFVMEDTKIQVNL